MVVEPLNDVMSHFRFVFSAYVVLFIIIVLNFYKSLHIRKNLQRDNSVGKLIQRFDLVIDIFCGLAMAAGLMFQGVLADNNALGHNTWFMALLVIFIVSFIIFVLTVIVVRKDKK